MPSGIVDGSVVQAETAQIRFQAGHIVSGWPSQRIVEDYLVALVVQAAFDAEAQEIASWQAECHRGFDIQVRSDVARPGIHLAVFLFGNIIERCSPAYLVVPTGVSPAETVFFISQVSASRVAHDVGEEHQVVGSLVADYGLFLAVGVVGLAPEDIAVFLFFFPGFLFGIFGKPDIGVGADGKLGEAIAQGSRLMPITVVCADDMDSGQRGRMQWQAAVRQHLLYLRVAVRRMVGNDRCQAGLFARGKAVVSLRLQG